jgi:hypothetical protein
VTSNGCVFYSIVLTEAVDFPDALRLAAELINYGGVGHTASLFTREGDPMNRSLALQVNKF